MFLYLRISLSLEVYLYFVHISLFLHLCIYVCVCMRVYPSFFRDISLFLHASLFLYLCIYVYVCMNVCTYLSFCLSVYIYLSLCIFPRVYNYMCIYLSLNSSVPLLQLYTWFNLCLRVSPACMVHCISVSPSFCCWCPPSTSLYQLFPSAVHLAFAAWNKGSGRAWQDMLLAYFTCGLGSAAQRQK